jgi:hypothetical protein
MQSTKRWYLSKTVWVGVLSVAMSGLEAYQNGASIPAIAMAVIGAAILIIRPLTTKTLTK